MKKFGAVAIVMAVGLGLAGCGAQEGEDVPRGVAAITEPPLQLSADSAESGPWGEWSMPAPGNFDYRIPESEFFRPCTDIPRRVLNELGMVLNFEDIETSEGYSCAFTVEGENPSDGVLSLGVYGPDGPPLIDESTVVAKHRIEEVPGAIVLGLDVKRGNRCEAVVPTARGLITVEYASFYGAPSGEFFCDLPEKIIKELYLGKTEREAKRTVVEPQAEDSEELARAILFG